MGFVIGLLTVVMVLDCLILIFLVLIQLPKKDAGAGLAFGGSATDALFGAGSGNVLTKITKYAAGTFFTLAIILSIMQSNYHRRTTTEFQQKLEQPNKPVISTTPPAPAAPATTPAAPATNAFRLSAPAESTNLPVPATKPATNPPSKK
jgi:preprotein translocase subunit SecG